ncbi:MAG: PhoU domain-containing protein [Thermodesulfobacteriota bacterium]
MYRELLSVFRKDTLMDRAYRRSYEMLDITQDMFLKAKTSLRYSESNQVDIDIYDRDAEVNRFEREVRRDVFNHLVVSGMGKLPSGLVLVSIIIDIERIGDYTKNMVELALNHPGKLHGGKFESDLQRVEGAVEDSFVRAKESFKRADVKAGQDLLKEYEWVSRTCDNCLFGLIKEEDKNIRCGDAVSLALYFRWLKRISSHLRNITTSVVNPFDGIGFKPE